MSLSIFKNISKSNCFRFSPSVAGIRVDNVHEALVSVIAFRLRGRKCYGHPLLHRAPSFVMAPSSLRTHLAQLPPFLSKTKKSLTKRGFRDNRSAKNHERLVPAAVNFFGKGDDTPSNSEELFLAQNLQNRRGKSKGGKTYFLFMDFYLLVLATRVEIMAEIFPVSGR